MIRFSQKDSERKLEAVKLEHEQAKRALREAKEELEEATEEYSKCADEYCSSRPPPPRHLSEETALDG